MKLAFCENILYDDVRARQGVYFGYPWGIGMPMLDYRCRDCGRKFEELVFSHNRDKVRCPACGSGALDRVYEGKCLFGSPKGGGQACSGKCSGCAGCSH